METKLKITLVEVPFLHWNVHEQIQVNWTTKVIPILFYNFFFQPNWKGGGEERRIDNAAPWPLIDKALIFVLNNGRNCMAVPSKHKGGYQEMVAYDRTWRITYWNFVIAGMTAEELSRLAAKDQRWWLSSDHVIWLLHEINNMQGGGSTIGFSDPSIPPIFSC